MVVVAEELAVIFPCAMASRTRYRVRTLVMEAGAMGVVRSLNALTQASIDTVSDLVSMTEGELNSVKNLGKKSLSEIKDKIRELGLSLSDTGEE